MEKIFPQNFLAMINLMLPDINSFKRISKALLFEYDLRSSKTYTSTKNI